MGTAPQADTSPPLRNPCLPLGQGLKRAAVNSAGSCPVKGQDDAKRRAHRWIEAVQEALRLSDDQRMLGTLDPNSTNSMPPVERVFSVAQHSAPAIRPVFGVSAE